ncbi:MAG: TusE/DsrC/DsvC family sulfur relay protein [Pseudomonadota bacterium]|nr:TusE/DsrC/DsvC family sulfur relay protein [Pseudomonadota bacterium]MDP1902978.1 TusE/DsrC/DsvC family sulfur relay protein [Pseudomonadota bacterium]MDP2352250.1 TusE/DsrC/DsvC family sulfur relay protein [Pseudomonadota bacterium]
MGYVLNGEELEVDDDGFLLEANFSEEIVPVIAAAENITLTDAHWQVVNFMRRKYQEDGQTPNFRNMLADLIDEDDSVDWKKVLYELFPLQPNRQSAKVAGLTKPFGKGGY